MAVTFDAKFEKGATGQASPFSFVSNAGTVTGSVGANSNRVLIGYVCFRGVGAGASAVAMTWNGVSMTAIGTKLTIGASIEELFLFGLIAPDTGAQTLSVSWTGGSASPLVLGGISVYNADQSTGWQNNTTATGTSTAPTVTVTSANGNMVVGGFADDNASSFTITSPATTDWNERAFDGNYEAGHQASTTGSTVFAATLGSSVAWGVNAVDVIQVSAGETITMDKWFPQAAPNKPAKWAPVASGIIGIRNT